MKKELIVMDEQPSKLQLPKINIFTRTTPKVEVEKNVKINEKLNDYSSSKTSTGYSSANSTSPISNYEPSPLSELDQMRLKFYSEIAARLKNLSFDNLTLKVY